MGQGGGGPSKQGAAREGGQPSVSSVPPPPGGVVLSLGGPASHPCLGLRRSKIELKKKNCGRQM